MGRKITLGVPVSSPEYQRRWYAKNADKVRAQKRAAYQANLEHSRALKRARQKRYTAKNPDKVRQINRDQYAKNRTQRLKDALEYQRKNLATTIKANRNNRRGRLRNAEGRITKAIVSQIRVDQGSWCNYCPTIIGNSGHLDHQVPLSRGGSNLRPNLQLLCQPCNSAKYNKTHEEFMVQRC